jgi:hypothetical protein
MSKIVQNHELLTRSGCRDEDGLIYEAMKLIGPLPERWKPYWNQKPFEDSNGVVFFVASNRIVNVHLSRQLNHRPRYTMANDMAQ